MREEDKSAATSFLTGAFIGGIVGAVLAMMFTPMSGEETREFIKKKSKDVGKKMDKVREDMEPKVTQVKKEFKKKIREMVD
jgi:gas vesicle protein